MSWLQAEGYYQDRMTASNKSRLPRQQHFLEVWWQANVTFRTTLDLSKPRRRYIFTPIVIVHWLCSAQVDQSVRVQRRISIDTPHVAEHCHEFPSHLAFIVHILEQPTLSEFAEFPLWPVRLPGTEVLHGTKGTRRSASCVILENAKSKQKCYAWKACGPYKRSQLQAMLSCS